MKRSLRDFLAWAGDAWRVERVSTQADLARGREILLQLHQQRWEKDAKPSVFSSPLFRGFHDQVLPQLLARNALDLCWLSVRDRPIAVNYNIVWRNRIYFYQGGRAVDVPRGVRPGIVLHLETIKRAINEGWEEYDLHATRCSWRRPHVHWSDGTSCGPVWLGWATDCSRAEVPFFARCVVSRSQ